MRKFPEPTERDSGGTSSILPNREWKRSPDLRFANRFSNESSGAEVPSVKLAGH